MRGSVVHGGGGGGGLPYDTIEPSNMKLQGSILLAMGLGILARVWFDIISDGAWDSGKGLVQVLGHL